MNSVVFVDKHNLFLEYGALEILRARASVLGFSRAPYCLGSAKSRHAAKGTVSRALGIELPPLVRDTWSFF